MDGILVTGAAGFVGRNLCEALGHEARVRRVAGPMDPVPEDRQDWVVRDLDGPTPWVDAMDGVETVVHLAARVHQRGETGEDWWPAYRRTNVEGSIHLAEEAVRAGVRRMVFLSTVGVHLPESPIVESSPTAPTTPYARSKLLAEQGLAAVAERSGLEVVVLRPPMVYGAGAPGSFAMLTGLVERGIPVPLGRFRRPRSVLYVGNLVDAIIRSCVAPLPRPVAVYLLADGPPIGTAEFVVMLGEAMGKRARLVSVSPAFLRLGTRMTGRGAALLQGDVDLAVDTSAIRLELGWEPPYDTASGLAASFPGEVAL